MKPIRRLLIIRLSALGDVCMTLPVIDCVCKTYPDIEFTFLTSKVGAIVASTILRRSNLNIRCFNKGDYNGIFGLNRLYSELKSLEFDAVADLHSVLRTHWLNLRFRIAGKPVARIDKGRSEKKALVSHAINQPLKSGFERYYSVFRQLGMTFDVNYDGAAVAHNLFGETPPKAPLSVGIAPFAQHQGKIYPASLMREVIDQLLQARPDIHIYLFGGREEKAILDEWSMANPLQVTNLAGSQGIDDDLKLMSGLKLMVSMDSANMHLASLVGLRCLSLWGATHPNAGFLGYNQRLADCIQLAMSCRPCSIYGNKPCTQGDYPCMNGIKPSQIVERILNCITQ